MVRALRTGKGRAASEAFQEMAALAADPAGAGRQLGGYLVRLWDDFFVEAVWGFAAWLDKLSENPAARAALEPIEPLLEAAREWQRSLRDIAGEREARMLREQVRGDALNDALKLSRSILTRAKSPESLRAQAVRLGVILGSLDHDRPAADKVMRRLREDLAAKGEPGRAAADGIVEGCDQSRNNLSLTEAGQRELAWNRMHTEAVVTLIQRLPDAATAGGPTPEQEERAWRAFQAMMAAYFRLAADGAAPFSDVARILREFCPTDQRGTGPVEGVEDVAFLRMNGLAKLTSVRTMRRLGAKKRVADATVQAFRAADRGSRASGTLVRLMGGLSNSAFTEDLLEALGDRKFRTMVDDIVDALGRVGDARCHVTLEKRLEDFAGARTLDPPKRRHMEAVIAALGRIARHPDTSQDDRNAIARRVFEITPGDRSLARAALSHFCAFDPAGLAPDVRRMAVRFIVDSLWSQDPTSRHAAGDPAQRTELGFREELVNILTNMGAVAQDALLEEAQRRAMQYSGAYWAVADVLAEIGDAKALPLLRMMLANAIQTNEAAIPEHLREHYFDGAQNKRVPLSKDKVAHALVFAVNKIGGAEGRKMLSDVAERIRSGRWDEPGSQTMELLASILVPDQLARDRDAERAAEATPESAEAAAGDDFSGLPSDWVGESGAGGAEEFGDAGGASDVPRPRKGDSEKALLKDILGKGLFKTKIEDRVSAIHEAAQRGETQYVDPLCQLLDSDQVVLRGAAETALLELVRPTRDEPTFRIGLIEMLDFLRKSSDAQGKAISALVMKMRPDRDPTRPIVSRYRATEDDERMKRILGDILSPPAHVPGARPASPAAAQPDAEGAPEGEGGKKKAVDTRDPLQIRMDYMAARRKWIEGGKQGDPPEPPKGYGGNL